MEVCTVRERAGSADLFLMAVPGASLDGEAIEDSPRSSSRRSFFSFRVGTRPGSCFNSGARHVPL
ncbi:MAG TPA: hypothetical protein PLU94_08705 [Methanoregulaceae archaeon]|nr:hypothetical protein [Burkholderiaceae bacterium]NLH25344.1 hypothetical protein [Methanomicrobiales archaeon]HPH35553.1 hypothetical protein [Methanoregulaceae archaeon]